MLSARARIEDVDPRCRLARKKRIEQFAKPLGKIVASLADRRDLFGSSAATFRAVPRAWGRDACPVRSLEVRGAGVRCFRYPCAGFAVLNA